VTDPTPPGWEATPEESQHHPPEEPATADRAFPWPPAENDSLVASVAETWRESVFSPTSFFRRLPITLPIGSALLYLLAVGVVAAGIQLFWDMVWLAIGLERSDEFSPAWLLMNAASPTSALIGFLLTPVFLIAVLYIGSGLTHVMLLLLRGGSAGYRGTLRVYAFSHGPQLFVVVPVIGWIIAFIWSIVITVVGLREVHRVPGWKPTVAVLAPVGCLFIATLLMVVLFAVGAMLLPTVGP
jgi:hypothetical protein